MLLLTSNDELRKLWDDKKCVELYPVVTCGPRINGGSSVASVGLVEVYTICSLTPTYPPLHIPFIFSRGQQSSPWCRRVHVCIQCNRSCDRTIGGPKARASREVREGPLFAVLPSISRDRVPGSSPTIATGIFSPRSQLSSTQKSE